VRKESREKEKERERENEAEDQHAETDAAGEQPPRVVREMFPQHVAERQVLTGKQTVEAGPADQRTRQEQVISIRIN